MPKKHKPTNRQILLTFCRCCSFYFLLFYFFTFLLFYLFTFLLFYFFTFLPFFRSRSSS